MKFPLRTLIFTSADIGPKPLKGWLLRQNEKCMASLTREVQLGGAVSPKVGTAGFYQGTN